MFSHSHGARKAAGAAVVALLLGAGGVAGAQAASQSTGSEDNAPGGRKPRPVSARGSVEPPAPAAAPQANNGDAAPAPPAMNAPQAPRASSPKRPPTPPPARPTAVRRASAPVAPVPALAPAPPPAEVITVVHRLSGWKLLSWLARARAPIVGVDELPFASDVHTNIVAGYVAKDGRTIVARLGQAEAEIEVEAASVPFAFTVSGEDDYDTPHLMVVRRDGQKFKARFVGVDSSTGLSLLEAAAPILPPSPPEEAAAAAEVIEGQRVRLFAPAPMRGHNLLPRSPRTLSLKMSEAKGQLTHIRRAPSGKAVQAGVRAPRLTPAWTGAVATDETGAFVGIVEQSAARETRLVTADAVREATVRVMARRASVPQPWLGVRGAAVGTAPLEEFVVRGWSREKARLLAGKRGGVILTEVAPGTPAALAGLRTGDVIARISEREIAGLEDFSMQLKNAGSGSTLSLTVLRALEDAPLKMAVTLSEALNPRFATQDAEMRGVLHAAHAVEAAARAVRAQARIEELSARDAVTKARAELTQAHAARDEARINDAEKQLSAALKQLHAAEQRVESAVGRIRAAAAQAKRAESRVAEARAVYAGGSFKPKLIDGLDVLAISPGIAAQFKARKGWLVVGVRPNTAAASTGLRAGDVIESINGRTLPGPHEPFEFFWHGSTTFDFGLIRNGENLTIKFPR